MPTPTIEPGMVNFFSFYVISRAPNTVVLKFKYRRRKKTHGFFDSYERKRKKFYHADTDNRTRKLRLTKHLLISAYTIGATAAEIRFFF